MRIGIDAGSMIGDRGGVGWHVYHLLTSLLTLNEDYELVVTSRRGRWLTLFESRGSVIPA